MQRRSRRRSPGGPVGLTHSVHLSRDTTTQRYTVLCEYPSGSSHARVQTLPGCLAAPIPSSVVVFLSMAEFGSMLANSGPSLVDVGPTLADTGPNSDPSGRLNRLRQSLVGNGQTLGSSSTPNVGRLRQLRAWSKHTTQAWSEAARMWSKRPTLGKHRLKLGWNCAANAGPIRPKFDRHRQLLVELGPNLADIAPKSVQFGAM